MRQWGWRYREDDCYAAAIAEVSADLLIVATGVASAAVGKRMMVGRAMGYSRQLVPDGLHDNLRS